MADDHTVYKGPEGRTTQWEDIQRKMGNLPPKEPPSKPDPWTPDKGDARDTDWLDSRDEKELEDLEDDFEDDRFLEQYRQVLLPLVLQQLQRQFAVCLLLLSRQRCRVAQHSLAALWLAPCHPIQPAVPWCRQQRMQQLKTEKQRPKFGTVTHITSRDFVQQVTNAGDEVWVVVHLYKDG